MDPAPKIFTQAISAQVLDDLFWGYLCLFQEECEWHHLPTGPSPWAKQTFFPYLTYNSGLSTLGTTGLIPSSSVLEQAL